ncbi:hypothetical protein [Absidia glauca]|uniref:Uncharacterized protein n=1 Tax=Absidia glauca TaxID=4829 RepID=A0A168LJT2_ABSGL|nr:hypothetical protein [Absidia glauca]
MQEWIGIGISISDLTVDIFPFLVILTEPHGHFLDYVTLLLTVSSHDTATPIPPPLSPSPQQLVVDAKHTDGIITSLSTAPSSSSSPLQSITKGKRAPKRLSISSVVLWGLLQFYSSHPVIFDSSFIDRSYSLYLDTTSSLDRELLDSAYLSFLLPDHDDHLIVHENFDVTNAFHRLQLSIGTHKWKLPLENHLHLALATTSILLLSRNQYPNDLQPSFTQSNIEATIDRVDDVYTINSPTMDMTTTTAMISILEDLTNTEITSNQATIRLLGLDLPAHQSKFREARYIDPFLSGLFDDQDNDMYLRWTNEATLDARKNDDFLTTRLDLCISHLLGSNWNMDHGFGEAKSAHQGNNNYVVCQDLLRIGDGPHNQISSRCAACYYIMRELATVQVPGSLNDLSKLVLDMPRVLLVLDVFSRLCIPSLCPPCSNRHTPRINASIIQAVFSSSRDRKRACSLQRFHN